MESTGSMIYSFSIWSTLSGAALFKLKELHLLEDFNIQQSHLKRRSTSVEENPTSTDN